jgi:hypothetical protein
MVPTLFSRRSALLKEKRWLVALGAIGAVTLCLISGLVGGALSHNFGTSSYTISYADFVTIMLTAISVLLVTLTIFLAVLGVVGWAAISNGVNSKTDAFLADGFKEGNPLFKLVEARVSEIVYAGVAKIDDTGEAAADEDEQ